MQNIRFVQIYKGDQLLHRDLLPRWIDFSRELDGHAGIYKADDEIILNLTRRINIQGNRKDMHFLLMYREQSLIGFANFAIDTGTVYGLLEPGCGTSMGFYIAPEFRRAGNGRLLYNHIEQVLIGDGAKAMYVCPGPVTGEPFWRAMGFADSGKIDPDDKLPIYIKQLA